MIITDVMTITKAGQVTIPKEIRKILGTSTIVFEVLNNNEIHILPIQSVEGALKEFAKPEKVDFTTVREKSWKQQTARLEKND